MAWRTAPPSAPGTRQATPAPGPGTGSCTRRRRGPHRSPPPCRPAPSAAAPGDAPSTRRAAPGRWSPPQTTTARSSSGQRATGAPRDPRGCHARRAPRVRATPNQRLEVLVEAGLADAPAAPSASCGRGRRPAGALATPTRLNMASLVARVGAATSSAPERAATSAAAARPRSCPRPIGASITSSPGSDSDPARWTALTCTGRQLPAGKRAASSDSAGPETAVERGARNANADQASSSRAAVRSSALS